MVRSRILVALLPILLVACTTKPDIHTASEPSADFSRYRSYSWAYTGPPPGMSQAVFDMIHASIDRALAKRGFTQANPGDFAVAFTVGRRDSVRISNFGSYPSFYAGPYWGPVWHDIDVRNVTQGTLVVDIYDTGTHKGVWHGIATKEVTPGKIDIAKLDAGVDSLLASFPGPGAPAAGAVPGGQ